MENNFKKIRTVRSESFNSFIPTKEYENAIFENTMRVYAVYPTHCSHMILYALDDECIPKEAILRDVSFEYITHMDCMTDKVRAMYNRSIGILCDKYMEK